MFGVSTACCYPINEPVTTHTQFAMLVVDPLVGVALLILAALALNGNLNISKAGAYALLIAGTFEFSQFMILIMASCINQCKSNPPTTNWGL